MSNNNKPAAAPGIDLSKLQRYRMASDANDARHLYKDDTGTWVKIQDVERAVIDASPKGGSTDAKCRASAWQTAFDSSVATHKRNKSRTWVLTCMREHFERLYSELQATSAEVGE